MIWKIDDLWMSMLQKFFLIILFFASPLFALKPPTLTPKDALETLRQMMEAHASCKEIDGVLVKRALEAFLNELDPSKTYLLKSEIEKWLSPSEALVEQIRRSLVKGDFSPFSEIHGKMVQAIARRNKLEIKIGEQPLPQNVTMQEFEELDWAAKEEELGERLLRIRSLQEATTKKLDEESQERVLRRIQKKRLSREEELCGADKKSQECHVLACVLKSFASSFDSHTSYFTPGEASQFMVQVQQRLFGIGAQLRDDLDGFAIVKIIEGGPSDNTALRVNDRIIAVNGEPVVGLEILDAVELIRGEEGTKVLLTVLRPTPEGDEKVNLEITRGEVVIKEARLESKILPYGDGVIAHIALHAFYQDPLHSSSADLEAAITKIQKEHTIKGLVLDLRYNAGGVLPQAVAVTGLFITKGIVCSIKDNNGTVEHLRDIGGHVAYDGPLIVLTSKVSASAAEIVAQALQDYGRAIVVGDEHTYGKGSFQTFSLDSSSNGRVNPKGEFKVTRGKYYTVSGKSPQLVGVIPDIIVPGVYSTSEIGERHAKYPLENDSIKENFHDDLSDIPLLQRDQISWLYRFNLQPRIRTHTRHCETLQKNSLQRIEKDPLYQAFLSLLKEEDVEMQKAELFIKSDPQLAETVNIMKDLIFLMK